MNFWVLIGSLKHSNSYSRLATERFRQANCLLIPPQLNASNLQLQLSLHYPPFAHLSQGMNRPMAIEMEPGSIVELSESQYALRAADLELNLERSKNSVEVVAKDEDIRKLRFQLLLQEDENDELHGQLTEEEARSDGLEQALDEALAQLEQVRTDKENEMRTHARESANIKAELKALEGVTTDSTKLLTEKLALSREISTLKPEVEYLRTQVESNQGLLSEKLSLQQQLNTIQAELENEKRTSARALAKQGKSDEQDAELQAEIESLQKELSKEKREREKAEKAVDRAEKATQKAQTDLETQKQATEHALSKEQKDTKNDEHDAQLEELRQELAKEKRERQKAEKESQKTRTEMEDQKAVLDDRLNAFRAKLKSTKEKLKETETELQKAQAAAAASKPFTEQATRNTRKRMAASVDPDATIGTPGDGLPAKRTKRGSLTLPGDKSTFSITPFLNRTASVAPDGSSPADEAAAAAAAAAADADDAEDPDAAPDATPSAPSKKAPKAAAKPKPKSKRKPLAPSSTNRINSKAPPRKKAAVLTLEKVAEETTEGGEEENSENAAPVPATAPAASTAEATAEKPTAAAAAVTEDLPIPKLRPSSRATAQPRKSLMSFAAFTDEPEPEKKKKRKLLGGGGGLGKTLFDVEGDAMPAKPVPGKGLFAARALGKGALLAGKAGGGDGGFMMTTADRKSVV